MLSAEESLSKFFFQHLMGVVFIIFSSQASAIVNNCPAGQFRQSYSYWLESFNPKNVYVADPLADCMIRVSGGCSVVELRTHDNKNYYCYRYGGGCGGSGPEEGYDLILTQPICAFNPECPPGKNGPFKNAGKPKDTCGVGNPINPGAGAKYQQEIDHSDPNGSLTFSRTYNSDGVVRSGSRLGDYWSHRFGDKIQSYTLNGQTLLMAFREDGKAYLFRQSGGVWTTDTDNLAELSAYSEPGLSGWKYIDHENDITEIYDSTGTLIRESNRKGITPTITYSDASTPTGIAPAVGLMIIVTDSFGRQLNFTYDAQSRIQTMTDPSGAIYTYSYDTNNNLLSVLYPDNKTRSYVYNESAYTSSTISPMR